MPMLLPRMIGREARRMGEGDGSTLDYGDGSTLDYGDGRPAS